MYIKNDVTELTIGATIIAAALDDHQEGTFTFVCQKGSQQFVLEITSSGDDHTSTMASIVLKDTNKIKIEIERDLKNTQAINLLEEFAKTIDDKDIANRAKKMLAEMKAKK